MDENTFLFWILGVPIVIFVFAIAIREGLFKIGKANMSEDEGSSRMEARTSAIEQIRFNRESMLEELRSLAWPRIESIQQQIIDCPDEASLRLDLGNLYFSIGEFDKAKESYELLLTDGISDQRLFGLVSLLFACSVNRVQWTETYNRDFILARDFDLPTVEVIDAFNHEGLQSIATHVGTHIMRDGRESPLARFHAEEAIKAFESVVKSDSTDLNALRILRAIYSYSGKPGMRQLGRIDNLIMKAETLARRSSTPGVSSARTVSTVEKGVTFERRCLRLLASMDYSVSLTGHSGDGGVDLRANNPALIKGGSIIVQCKDWQKPVGEPILRDLYGLVISEGAGKGVIIASSRFTRAATDFANGKPLELIDGNELEALERKYLGPN